LLGIICVSYPIHGLEGDAEIIELYDLDKYKGFQYPSLEFACDYIGYIYNNEQNEIKDPFAGEPRGEYVKEQLSFRINRRFESSLLALTKKLNVNVEFLREKQNVDVSKLFVDVLLADDVSVLDRNHYQIRFNCQTRLVVYIFGNIKENYNPKNFDAIIDRSGLFFSKQSIPFRRSLLYTERNRLKFNDPIENAKIVDRIFIECHPSKY
jgi:hypothetical protein